MSDKEVVVPREWFKSLLKYSERVEKNLAKREPTLNESQIGLHSLIGFISSAKTILGRD